MEIKTLQDQLQFLTFRLETGDTSATGFAYQTNKKNIIVISNRHFAEQTDELDFAKHEIKQSVKFSIHLNNGEALYLKDTVTWYLHPSEDLAFFNLSEILNKNESFYKPHTFLFKYLSKENIPTQSKLETLDVISDVIMVGYPNGLIDKVNLLPLCRAGKTAFHPALNFNGKKHGVVDMTCVPGSSGSPIFILQEGVVSDRDGNMSVGQPRLIFLGIEFSMPIRPNVEVYELTLNNKPNKTNYFVYEDINYGNYIKSEEILKFESFFDKIGI